MLYQLEKSTTGTLHYQGYTEWDKSLRKAAIRKCGGWYARAHWEPRMGSQQQAVNYCKKPTGLSVGDTDEKTHLGGTYGVPSIQGNQAGSKLAGAMALIKSGASMQMVAEQEGEQLIKHFKGLAFYKQMQGHKRTWKSLVAVYWGNSGTGKSFTAHQNNPDAWVFPKTGCSAIWFDGYDGQDCIIIDDYYGEIPLPFMLNFLDAYPQLLPIKGGFVPNLAKRIVITSNVAPEAWYQKEFMKVEQHKLAFMRRLDLIVEFKTFTDFTLHKGEGFRHTGLTHAPTSSVPMGDAKLVCQYCDMELDGKTNRYEDSCNECAILHRTPPREEVQLPSPTGITYDEKDGWQYPSQPKPWRGECHLDGEMDNFGLEAQTDSLSTAALAHRASTFAHMALASPSTAHLLCEEDIEE